METNVKSIYHNTYELIHEWCNNKLKSTTPYYMGDYSCTKDDFWVGSLHIASKISGIIYLTYFDRQGVYNSGYSMHDFARAIPYNDAEYYIVDELPTKETFKNKKLFAEWFKNEYIHKNLEYLNNLSFIKEFISNNRYKAIYVTLDSLSFDKFNFCPKKYIEKFAKTINNIQIKKEVRYTKYTGWSSYGENLPPVIINHTIGEIRNKESFIKSIFTDKELDWYEFKLWHLTYGVGISIHDSRKIYVDKEARENRTKRINEYIKKAEKEKELKELEKCKESHIKFIKELEEWKDNNETHMPNSSFSWNQAYQSIKLIKGKGVTTLRVHVPLEELKKAYIIFKLFKNKDKIYKRLDRDKEQLYDTIHGYSVLYIGPKQFNVIENNELIIKEVWCMVIGCHKVPEFEIYDFIKRNNLNW